MDKHKLILPVVILLGCIILGGFFYASQVNKQKSIEQQQWIKLQDDRQQQDINNAIEKLKLKQDECKALSAGVMKKWNNVMGVTYDDDLWKECVVTYTDTKTGEIKVSPLSSMKTN
jgi:hypothetical protein